jgi:hypothetical protein
MNMVVGMICTTDPPGTRIYRHVTSPTTSANDTHPVYTPPAPPPVSPFAAGRVPGGACEVNGVRGTFNSNLECVLDGGAGPLVAPQAAPDAPHPVLYATSYDPAPPDPGTPMAMPTGHDEGGGGEGAVSPVTLLAAGVALFFLARKL